MTNAREIDESAKTEGAIAKRDNSTFFLEALEIKNFTYSPSFPCLLRDHHNKSMTLF